MAKPAWDESRQRWRYRITKNGETFNFYSKIKGPAGRREVLHQAESIEAGIVSQVRIFKQEWILFLEDIEARSSRCNLQNLEQLGRLYILPELQNKKMFELKITDLQKCINAAKKKDGSLLSKKSYSNIKNALTNFINFARLDGTTDIIANGLYVPRSAESSEKKILQREEVKLIFNEFEDEYYINLWRIMLLTGMRPSEALGLKWNDVTEFTIQIHRGINRNREITDGKNKNARRSIPRNSLINEILVSQKRRTSNLNSEWIFPVCSGEMPSQSSAFKSIERIGKKLGKKISPYCLRHTFVSLLKNELPESMMKQIIGHSSSMPTYHGTYAHELEGERLAASQIIEDSMKKLV